MKNLVKHSAFLVILLAILLSCKPQKSVIEYKYITRVDTLVKTEITTVYKGVNDTITIDNPCDSTGIINSFYSKLVLPNGTVTISSQRESNKLVASVNVDDFVSNNKTQKKSSATESVVYKDKEVIKYRIPSWIIYILIIETLLIALYIYLRIKRFIK